MDPDGLNQGLGRAGPICRRAFARPYKPMVNGKYSFWKPDTGTLKGRSAGTFVNERTCKTIQQWKVDLSETAGAESL